MKTVLRLTETERVTLDMAMTGYINRVRTMAMEDVMRQPRLVGSWERRLLELRQLHRRLTIPPQRNLLTRLFHAVTFR